MERSPKILMPLPKGINARTRRRSAVAAALLALTSAALVACTDDADEAQSASSDWNTGNKRDEHPGQMLAHGREDCIAKMKSNGISKEDAEQACDKAYKDAMEQAKANGQQFAATDHNNGGGGNSALMWYLIGRNMSQPAVYYEDPARRGSLNYVGGGYVGGGYVPPRSFSAADSALYSQTPSARASAIIHLTPRGHRRVPP